MLAIEELSLSRAVENLRKEMGDNLVLVIAFGSRVRGDFHGESDFDVLVVVKKRNFEVLEKVIEIFMEEEERTGVPFSVILRDEENFEKEKTLMTGFFINILREGKVIYGKITP